MKSLSNFQFTIKSFKSVDEIPEALIKLREDAYVDELKDWKRGELFTREDLECEHVMLYDEETLVGASSLGPVSSFPKIEAAIREGGYCSLDLRDVYVDYRNVLHPDYRKQGLYQALVYYNYSYLRSKGIKRTVAFFPDDRDVIATSVWGATACTECSTFRHKRPDGSSFDLVLHQMPDPNYINFVAWKKLSQEWKVYMADHVIHNFITKKVESEIQTFYQSAWFQKIQATKLSKSQYIETMGNILSYVRWTTRMLAKAVGNTSDKALRKHFLEHLKGEVDHDEQIITDLKHLDANIEYINDYMTADPDIAVFMSTQSTLLEFYKKPEVFLAVPYTVEGFTAFLNDGFIEALRGNVEAWGVSQPAKATRFLASHIHTDGDEENGHWVMGQRILKHSVRDESTAAQFLQAVQNTSDSMRRGFTNIVNRPDLAMPTKTSRSAHAA